jgi:hypothetical protein
MSYSDYEVFLIGEAFRYGAEILLMSLGGGPLADLGDFQYVLTANHALALEHYFKCLLLMDCKRPENHHVLWKHFEKLPCGTQDAIRKRYDEIVKADASLQAEFARLREVGEDPDQIFDFDNALRASSKTFEQSRYPYDPKYKTHAYFGDRIARAVRSIIVDRDPARDMAFVNLMKRGRIRSTSQAH